MILASMEILLVVVAVQVLNTLVFVWSRRWVTRVSSLCRGYQRNNWAISGVSSHWKHVELAHVAAMRAATAPFGGAPGHVPLFASERHVGRGTGEGSVGKGAPP